MDAEGFIGIFAGVILGGNVATLLALILGLDPGWGAFILGAVVGAPVGYVYGEAIFRWLWWW